MAVRSNTRVLRSGLRTPTKRLSITPSIHFGNELIFYNGHIEPIWWIPSRFIRNHLLACTSVICDRSLTDADPNLTVVFTHDLKSECYVFFVIIYCSGLKKVAQMWTVYSKVEQVEASPQSSCYLRTSLLTSSPKPTIKVCKLLWNQECGVTLHKPWDSPTTRCRASARFEKPRLPDQPAYVQFCSSFLSLVLQSRAVWLWSRGGINSV